MVAAPRDVLITGMGAVSALGAGQEALWDAVASGRDGIAPLLRFPTAAFRVRTGAVVAACATAESIEGADALELCRRFAHAAIAEALRDAGLPDPRVRRERIALVLGTGAGGPRQPVHEIADELARSFGFAGPCLTVSNACSSSTAALGVGRDLLAMRAADVVIAGGSDVLSPEVFAGFHALGVLSPERCAPFSLPAGTTMGEGAGFLVLERAPEARARGARTRAALGGYALSGDAFHETSPDPTGSGIERAVRGAIADASLSADAIGYVNAHGSGTAANDPAEWRGIQRALDASARALPVSSTKGALGHAQGAAGALEAIVTLLAREHGMAPPTLNYSGPRPFAPADPIGQPLPRACEWTHALSVNSAFGGANAAMVLSRDETTRPTPERRQVAVLGAGGVGAWGHDGPLPIRADRAALRGRVPPFAIERLVRTADPRGLDPLSRYLIAAAHLAMADAGSAYGASAGERTGLFVAANRPSPHSTEEFYGSISTRGLPGLSAPAFTRIVLNAAAGFCSKVLGLRGPLSTLSCGPGGALLAMALAAEYVATHADADRIVVGGAGEAAASDDAPAGDGAVCVVLGAGAPSGNGAAARNGKGADARNGNRAAGIRLAGWGIAGYGALDDAVTRAGGTDDAGPTFREADWRAEPACGEDALAPALAFAAALRALRAGEAREALVTSDPHGATTVALRLTR
jgi:3-oxoacyl-[acyl-carrier-protein] synthase II